MGTIFTYLEDVQYDHFYDRPLTVLDLLLLTELTYLDFQALSSEQIEIEQRYRLSDLPQLLTDTPSVTMTKNRRLLLEKVAQTKRYKNIKLLGYTKDTNLDLQKQFAAMTYQVAPQEYIIAFRGTDDSIVGWKEDFHMTYMAQVPAQKTAVAYVESLMTSFPQATFMLTGHSKGGNLATYSASNISSDLQERIKQIYSFDAPGLHHTVIQKEGYQAVAEKIKRYIPQGSIVGMMLETPKQAQIVKSRAIGGIAQHDTFSWEVNKDQFVLLDTLNPDSLQMDETLKEWVKTVPDEELKDFFDTFFGIILDAGVVSIDDFFQVHAYQKIRTILQNAQSLDTCQKEMLERLMRLLISIRYQAWLKSIHQPSTISDLLTSLEKNMINLTEKIPFLTKNRE